MSAGRLVFGLILVAAAVQFADLHVDPDAVSAPTGLERVAAGEAVFPFQYRVLMPAVDHGAWSALHRMGWNVSLATVAAAVEALLAVLLVLVFLRTLTLFLDHPGAVRIGALGLFIPLWTVYLGRDGDTFWHASDLASCLVFALALLALAKDRLGWFYAVFLLGTLNRETTIFLVPTLVLSHARLRSKRRLAWHAGALAAAWVGVKALLVLAYSAPSQPLFPPLRGVATARLFDWTLGVNLRRLVAEPVHTLQLVSLFGYSLVPVWVFRRGIPSPWVQRLLWVSVPFAAAMTLVGVLLEFRIWGELIPLYWLAAVLLVAGSLGVASGEPPGVARSLDRA